MLRNQHTKRTPSDYSSAIVYDGGDLGGEGAPAVPQLVSVAFNGADNVTAISYCITPTPGSLTTQIRAANGSVDTSGIDPVADNRIGSITETHNYLSNSDILGPETEPTIPAQGEKFQTRTTAYPNLWVPSGTSVSICNTDFQFDTDNGTGDIGALGCVIPLIP